MAGRSRPGGRSGGRGRRPDPARVAVRYLMWRTVPGRVWLFWGACRSHPVLAWGFATWLTIWLSSGSGKVALVATPALWLVGAGVWFRVRLKRTGLSVKDAAAQLRRERRVRRQWDLACEAGGLKVTPRLSLSLWDPGVRSEGDTVVAKFNASAAGIPQGAVLSGLRAMGEVIGGGCRGARMTALGHSGWLEVRFAWGNPLGRVITPNMLPAAPKGTAPFGVTEDGAPVAYRMLNDRGELVFTPLLIAGATGSGKSSSVWGALLGFLHLGIPVRLHVADPAGGMELAALEDALNARAGTPLFQVVAYADTEDGINTMVKRMAEQMDARMRVNKDKRVRAHIPTMAEPVHLLLIDELLYLDDLLKLGKKGPLGRIQLAGRKAGYSVVACTQLSRAADLNPQIRDLFKQRLVFKVPSKEAVETALGSGNGWADKAPAHTIREQDKGVGYAIDYEGQTTASTEAVRFRSVWIEDHQTEYIARGEFPPGVESYAREELDPHAFKHFTYEFYDAGMALIYNGETNDLDRRWAEHRRNAPWWGEVVQDSEHIITRTYFGATPGDAEKAAKLAESHTIRTGKPRHNRAENHNNPLRVVGGSDAA